jgi:hypothetical protein
MEKNKISKESENLKSPEIKASTPVTGYKRIKNKY